MFHVKRQHRWLISKSSFSRQCVGRIRDTCSQLTWKSPSPHTHGGTFWPTLTPAQILYLHKSCQNKPKSEVCKTALSTLATHVASSLVVFMIHVDTKLTHTYTDQFNGRTFRWTWFSWLPFDDYVAPFVLDLCNVSVRPEHFICSITPSSHRVLR